MSFITVLDTHGRFAKPDNREAMLEYEAWMHGLVLQKSDGEDQYRLLTEEGKLAPGSPDGAGFDNIESYLDSLLPQ